MVQCVAEADETGAYCFQVGGLKRERFEEMIDLFASFGRRVVSDGFSGEPPPASIDCTMGDLQDCPPGGLEGDLPSRFGDCRIETTNRRLAALAGDSIDEPCELIEPRIEHTDPRKLKETTESPQRPRAPRQKEPTPPQSPRRGERTEKKNPNPPTEHTKDDVPHRPAPPRNPPADHPQARRRRRSN